MNSRASLITLGVFVMVQVHQSRAAGRSHTDACRPGPPPPGGGGAKQKSKNNPIQGIVFFRRGAQIWDTSLCKFAAFTAGTEMSTKMPRRKREPDTKQATYRCAGIWRSARQQKRAEAWALYARSHRATSATAVLAAAITCANSKDRLIGRLRPLSSAGGRLKS
jgi:hypothetical protein